MIYFEKKEKYLLISGEGNRKDLSDVQENSKKMYSQILESKTRLVLIDYRKVTLSITNTDVFNSIRFYEAKLPLLTGIVVAAVFNNNNKVLGKTWTDVGNARGFNFKVFTDFDEAEGWLLSQ